MRCWRRNSATSSGFRSSPSVEIPFVIGSHIHVGDILDPTSTLPAHAVANVRELFATLKPPAASSRNHIEIPMTYFARAVEHGLSEHCRHDSDSFGFSPAIWDCHC